MLQKNLKERKFYNICRCFDLRNAGNKNILVHLMEDEHETNKGVQGTLCGTTLIIHFVADLHTNAIKSAKFMTSLFVEICAEREHLKFKKFPQYLYFLNKTIELMVSFRRSTIRSLTKSWRVKILNE